MKWHKKFQKGLRLLLLVYLQSTQQTHVTGFPMSTFFLLLWRKLFGIRHACRYSYSYTDNLFFILLLVFSILNLLYLSEWQVKWSIFSSVKFRFKKASMVKVCFYKVLGFYFNALCLIVRWLYWSWCCYILLVEKRKYLLSCEPSFSRYTDIRR